MPRPCTGGLWAGLANNRLRVSFDSVLAHHCAPDAHLIGEERAQFLRAAELEINLQRVRELAGDRLLAQCGGELAAEALHQRLGSAVRGEDAPPRVGLEPGITALDHGRQIGKVELAATLREASIAHKLA